MWRQGTPSLTWPHAVFGPLRSFEAFSELGALERDHGWLSLPPPFHSKTVGCRADARQPSKFATEPSDGVARGRARLRGRAGRRRPGHRPAGRAALRSVPGPANRHIHPAGPDRGRGDALGRRPAHPPGGADPRSGRGAGLGRSGGAGAGPMGCRAVAGQGAPGRSAGFSRTPSGGAGGRTGCWRAAASSTCIRDVTSRSNEAQSSRVSSTANPDIHDLIQIMVSH